MKSSNIEEFNLLVDEYLKQDSRYERQIRNFQSFLKEYGLEDKVFNLYEDNINDFFVSVHFSPPVSSLIAYPKSFCTFSFNLR